MLWQENVLMNDLHAHSKHSCFLFPCPNLVNSELGQRHSSNKEQNICKGNGKTMGVIQPCQR